MKTDLCRLAALQAGLLILASFAAIAETPWDYRTLVIDGEATDASSAHVIDRTDVGSVGYHHARAEAPALWFQAQATEGKAIPVRLGVPALDRYRQLRPAVAVLGAGLPPLATDLPFDVPAGLGGVVYNSGDLDVERYENKYAGVVSWRFGEIEYTPLSTGTLYIVAFIPQENGVDAPEGKFWLTVGKGSSFRLADLFKIYSQTFKIRAFFEDAVIVSYTFSTSIVAFIMGIVVTIVALL